MGGGWGGCWWDSRPQLLDANSEQFHSNQICTSTTERSSWPMLWRSVPIKLDVPLLRKQDVSQARRLAITGVNEGKCWSERPCLAMDNSWDRGQLVPEINQRSCYVFHSAAHLTLGILIKLWYSTPNTARFTYETISNIRLSVKLHATQTILNLWKVKLG